MLEAGKKRRAENKNYIFAIEEPELHIPPSLQLGMIQNSKSIANQIIITTHSPRVAAFVPATYVKVLHNKNGQFEARPLLNSSLTPTTPNGIRKLFIDHRAKLVEAIIAPNILIPEGRIEYEIFRLMCELIGIYDQNQAAFDFNINIGLIPTQDACIINTFLQLSQVHENCFVLVDGDTAGDDYINDFEGRTIAPKVIIQWPRGLILEDIINWIINSNPTELFNKIKPLDMYTGNTLPEFIINLKTERNTGTNGLKGNYLFYENLISVLVQNEASRTRIIELLNNLSLAIRFPDIANPHYSVERRLTNGTKVVRWVV